MKGRSIHDNLHFVHEILEATLINLDQSMAFYRVDHRFLAIVLETAGFQLEFRKWISMMYHNPQAVVQVNGKRSEAFAVERLTRQGCPLSPLFYVFALEPLLRRLSDEKASPALCGIHFVGPLSTKVSAYVSVSHCLDVKGVKKAVATYKLIAGVMINFD